LKQLALLLGVIAGGYTAVKVGEHFGYIQKRNDPTWPKVSQHGSTGSAYEASIPRLVPEGSGRNVHAAPDMTPST
jgi:hypothetical protein